MQRSVALEVVQGQFGQVWKMIAEKHSLEEVSWKGEQLHAMVDLSEDLLRQSLEEWIRQKIQWKVKVSRRSLAASEAMKSMIANAGERGENVDVVELLEDEQ